jgi:hypothetical protein
MLFMLAHIDKIKYYKMQSGCINCVLCPWFASWLVRNVHKPEEDAEIVVLLPKYPVLKKQITLQKIINVNQFTIKT